MDLNEQIAQLTMERNAARLAAEIHLQTIETQARIIANAIPLDLHPAIRDAIRESGCFQPETVWANIAMRWAQVRMMAHANAPEQEFKPRQRTERERELECVIADLTVECKALRAAQSKVSAPNALVSESLAVFDLMLQGCSLQCFGDYQNGDGETIGPRMDALHDRLRAAGKGSQASAAPVLTDADIELFADQIGMSRTSYTMDPQHFYRMFARAIERHLAATPAKTEG